MGMRLKLQYFYGKVMKEVPENDTLLSPSINCISWAGSNDFKKQFSYVDEAGKNNENN